MTGKERITARLAHQPVDSLPLMPITMMFAGDVAGIRYRDYASDYRKLVEAQLKTAETYDLDYVSAISDPAREASDLGAAIEWFDDQPPAIIESRALLEQKGTLGKLSVPQPAAGPRMSDRVEAVRLLADKAGSRLTIEGWVEGPCAMAADLRGVNTLMLDFFDDPSFVEDLFAFVVEMELGFARAQIDAGATLVGIGDAAASLVGPKLYRNFVLDWEKKLIAGVQAMGAPVRLHICGNTRKILDGMGETGAAIVDLDYPSPLREARAAMRADQVLLGNIDPVRVLRDGSPESVEAALQQCHDGAGAHYITGAGCEVPRGTPHENMMAMTRFARSRH